MPSLLANGMLLNHLMGNVGSKIYITLHLWVVAHRQKIQRSDL